VLLLLLVLENADVSPSERLNKSFRWLTGIVKRASPPVIHPYVPAGTPAPHFQQIEHEHDDEHEDDFPELRNLGFIIFIS
jgi:hypothetical protein